MINTLRSWFSELNIQTKIALAISIAFLCVSIIFYTLISTFMNNMVSSSEDEKMLDGLRQHCQTLDYTTSVLRFSVPDWAEWDDTYAYMQDEYPEFPEDCNLYTYPVDLFHLDLLALVSNQDKPIDGVLRDSQSDTLSGDIAILAPLLTKLSNLVQANYIKNINSGLNITFNTHRTDGLISYNGTMYYLCAYPILKSDSSGPSVGTFIMGRVIDSAYINQYLNKTGTEFVISSLSQFDVRDEERNELDRQSNSVYLDDQTGYVRALLSLSDIFGQKTIVASYATRSSLQQLSSGYLISLGIMLVMLILAGSAVLLLSLERMVLSQIRTLNAQVTDLITRDRKNISPNLFTGKEFKNLTGIIYEMLEKKAAHESMLEYQAHYDMHTDLPNQRKFNEVLAESTARADQEGHILCAYYFDVSGIKYINNTVGRQQGDQLILTMVEQLKEICDRSICLARLEGVEFALLSRVGTPDEATQIAQSLVTLFEKPFIFAGGKASLRISIGLSLYYPHSKQADQLLNNADLAMYRARSQKGNAYFLFDEALRKEFEKRVLTEHQLREAVMIEDFKGFQAYFQPKVESQTGLVTCCEALIRWEYETKILPPFHFIPLAEETGLIIPLTAWMLKEACGYAMTFAEGGLPIEVSVNISSQVLLHPDFMQMVEVALMESGLPAHFLDLEITEDTLVSNQDAARDILLDLKKRGMTVSIDDFGKGYSSLSYLKEFPIDRIKIDRCFIMGLPQSNADSAIVDAIITMNQKFKFLTTAEGVETEEQFDYLKAAHCDEIQGYLVSRPIPAYDFLPFCLKWNNEHLRQMEEQPLAVGK